MNPKVKIWNANKTVLKTPENSRLDRNAHVKPAKKAVNPPVAADVVQSNRDKSCNWVGTALRGSRPIACLNRLHNHRGIGAAKAEGVR